MSKKHHKEKRPEIRVAPLAPEQVPDVLRMAEQFHAAAKLGATPFDEGAAAAWLTNIQQTGVTLVATNGTPKPLGVIALVVMPSLFSMGMAALPIFAWAENAQVTGALLQAAKSWASEQGALSLVIVAPSAAPEMTRACVDAGFRLSTGFYLKGIEPCAK